jgi:hypothetical protein
MSTDKSRDNHCDYNNFKRTRYFHGMLMTDRDFREEQIYHNEKRKLLNRMLHGWGIVCGLDIKWEAGKNLISIEPGVALDCHGNEIVVCEPYELDLGPATCLGIKPPKKPLTPQDCADMERADTPNMFYIAMRYNEVPTDPVPVYAPAGGCDEKVCDYSRTREGFCVDVFSQMPYQPQDSFVSPSLIQRILDICKGIGVIRDGETYDHSDRLIGIGEDASSVDGYYNGMEIRLEYSAGAGGYFDVKRKIVNYYAENQNVEIDQPLDPVPDPNTSLKYEITNNDCIGEQIEEFKPAFCAKPLACPQCCPEEHYLILGVVEMDPTQWTVSNIYINNPKSERTYVPTVRLGRFLFKSLLNGLEGYFEATTTEGESEPIPDINTVHTNPIAALCWVGQALIDNLQIEFVEKQAIQRTKIGNEVSNLKREVSELRATVAQLTATTKKKSRSTSSD